VTAARLGHAFSVHGLSGNLGWAAAPLFVAGIASVAGWRAAGLSAAALGAAALMILVLRREALDEGATRHVVVARDDARPDAGSSGLAFLGSGAVWMCFLFFLFATGAFGVLQSYAPAVLGQVYGLPLALATAALTAYLLGAAAGTVAGGFVAGKVEHNDRVIALALGASAAIAVLLALDVVPSWSVIGFMACMGFGVGIATPSRDMLVRKAATSRFGKQSFGRIYGFVYSGLDIGLAATPLVIGPFLDRGEFAAALFAVALLQSAALLSAARVGRGLRAGRHS
jgi:predicted MFS family arabinose efflux permease